MTFATADKNQLLLRVPAILPSVGISCSYLKLGPIQYSFRDKLNKCRCLDGNTATMALAIGSASTAGASTEK